MESGLEDYFAKNGMSRDLRLGFIGGGGVYSALGQVLGGQDKASDFLRAKGIPGIRYLDGGSRAAGDGTRNFVVFDDSILKILNRE